MSNTRTINKKKKENSSREKKNPVPDFLQINIRGKRVTIIDYSKHEDYQLLIAFLEAAGFKAGVKTESFCG